MPELHYLGPAETFAEQAAKTLERTLGDRFDLIPKRSLEELIENVDDSTFAVVPYYNLYEGLVQETLDLITENGRHIAAAQRISVKFAIGRFPGTSPDADDVVYSHPKAIPQCSVFLSQHFRYIRRQEVLSTAEATRVVVEKRSGLAIARREALQKAGLEIIADDIGNRQYGRTNFTEFLLVTGNGSVPFKPLETVSKSRTMIAVIPTSDRVGLLADILGQISFFGINLLKIHSRPGLIEPVNDVPIAHDPQMFYLEMETPTVWRIFELCMETLNLRLSRTGESSDHCVRVLGTYPLFES